MTKRMAVVFGGFAMASVLAACAEAAEPAELTPTLREVLDEDVRLAITPTTEAGTITAAHRDGTGWLEGAVTLAVESGALAIEADATGAIQIEELSLELAPIEIPESLIGQEAALIDVRVALRSPVRATTSWFGPDAARVTTTIELELSWSLLLAGTTLPIGAPELPPVPLVIDVVRDGEGIAAEVRIAVAGELWSWASLLRLAELNLTVGATDRSETAPGPGA